ncbi:MAG: hypothetical protein KAH07_08395 [Flavobacteriaceae bacterium]|nr:hypothetical protein [Flavobacteriaceae bacterium]
MKKTILKQPLFYLSLLLVMAISFNSCNDDDDNTKSFLEKYAGTTWENTDAGMFVRFNSDISILAESWEYKEYYPYRPLKEVAGKDTDMIKPMVCYEYETFEGANIEVIKSSENKLVVKVTWDAGDPEDFETMTFTEINNTISVLIEKEGEDSMSLIFTSSDEDVDELKKCSMVLVK